MLYPESSELLSHWALKMGTPEFTNKQKIKRFPSGKSNQIKKKRKPLR